VAIEITEKMIVRAPVDEAWRFIVDPQRVVTCMPGAELVERIDEQTYVGRVKVKLGAITTAYKGEVVFAAKDEAARTLQLTGEGRETGGGTAKGTLDVRLSEVPDGTEMVFDIRVDLTGRVMQMGRGMIKGVSGQLFKQFATAAQQQIQAAAEPGAAGETPPSTPATQDALSVGNLVGRTIWQAIVDFFKRLFGRGGA
jgi:carbon monoxide dehydrogenase subunit G